jgi:hypothetical protein
MHFTLAQKGRPLWVTTNWRYNHPSIPVFPPLFLRPTYHLICIRSYTICQSTFEITSSTSRHSCVLALLWSYHFSEQWRNSTPQTRTMKTQGFGPSRTYRRKKKRLPHWCLPRFVPCNLGFTRIYIYTRFFHYHSRPSDIVAYCPNINGTVRWGSLICTTSIWPFDTYCLLFVDLLPTVPASPIPLLILSITRGLTFRVPHFSFGSSLWKTEHWIPRNSLLISFVI